MNSYPLYRMRWSIVPHVAQSLKKCSYHSASCQALANSICYKKANLLASYVTFECSLQKSMKNVQTLTTALRKRQFETTAISRATEKDILQEHGVQSVAADTLSKQSLSQPSKSKTDDTQVSIKIPKQLSSDELPSPVKRYFLGHFSKYLEKFQQSLAKKMPGAFHILKTFSVGFKEFVVDFRDYIRVLIKLSVPFYDLEDLSRREIELYYNMPRQMIRVSPVLIVSSLPLAQNVALPVAYWFPRHLLCYHFWDKTQRQDFGILYLTRRLYNARPVFRALQARLNDIDDPMLKDSCQSVFFSLGSGIHPSLQEVLDLKELFTAKPYHINSLTSSHINGLLRLHQRSVWGRRRKRLYEHARYIHYMDKALYKEGLASLTHQQLENMSLLRGASPSGMTGMEITEYLEKWIKISVELNENCFSLLLHLPIFLAYNHPSNLILIYK